MTFANGRVRAADGDTTPHIGTLGVRLLLGIKHDFEIANITLTRFTAQITLYKELFKVSDG